MINQNMWGGNLTFCDNTGDYVYRHCQEILGRRSTQKSLRALWLQFVAREGIFPMTVIPAVVELALCSFWQGRVSII